ncbi:TatD family hydrolase [bacterium]|nr:TatD family hydrolase [bacterium]
MVIIEPHIHTFSRTTDDFQNMFAANIRAVVEPSFWLGSDRRYAGTFFDYFRLILEFETIRLKRFGIDHFAAIAVNPKESENRELVDEVLAGIGEYLDHERCVALGEIGLNNITANEIYSFKRQLQMAEEREMPVVIHLPHFNKSEGIRVILDVINETGASGERILIDHNTEETLAVAKQSGCYTGLTVYPYSKLNPQRVSALIKEFGYDKTIVSGSADWGVSDPLSLPKTIEFMRKDGHPEEVLEKIFYNNAMAFYSHSPNWKPDFMLRPVPVSEYQR